VKQNKATKPQQQAQSQQAQKDLKIRFLSVEEAVAMAFNRRRLLLREGKTTRRITIPLHPSIIPPTGEFQTALGTVRIKATFNQTKGKWYMLVILPVEEGFTLADHLPNTKRPSPSQGSPN
jgi:hypothetical protein